MNESRDSDEDRLAVWVALSEFFFDTELDLEDDRRIARVLAKSPYSIEEIKGILRDEVYPVLIRNLGGVTGQWSGFDREWLRETLVPRMNRRPRFWRPRLRWGMIRHRWARVSALVEELRRGPEAGSLPE